MFFTGTGNTNPSTYAMAPPRVRDSRATLLRLGAAAGGRACLRPPAARLFNPVGSASADRLRVLAASAAAIDAGANHRCARASLFRVSSIRIILNSLPLFGSVPKLSSVLVSAPVMVSISRIVAGFFVSGQLYVYFHVSVLPSCDSSPTPVMIPVLWLSIHVETNRCATLSKP